MSPLFFQITPAGKSLDKVVVSVGQSHVDLAIAGQVADAVAQDKVAVSACGSQILLRREGTQLALGNGKILLALLG